MKIPRNKFRRHPRIRTFHTVETCESTQILAKDQAEHGALDGTLILADEQTHGYGRQGRHWHSPRGGLWWSLILRPQMTSEEAISLSAVASLGILEGLRKATGAPCRLKWPNDILLEGKKLAGVIIDTSLKGPHLEWAVLGAGINVNNPIPAELKEAGTSLSLWSKRQVDFTGLFDKILDGFYSTYDLWKKSGFSALRSLYIQALEGLGERVKIEISNQIYDGTAVDIDPKGRLLIQFSNAKKRPFSSAEAHLLATPI